MIFQKSTSKNTYDEQAEVISEETIDNNNAKDDVETIVGPSVNVEGDFSSEGNIIVKGSVAGSVHTSRYLTAELGARIMANVRAGSAKISGEVKGNVKVKDTLELTATARVVGDIEAKVLVVEAGALVYGKVSMPGLDTADGKVSRIRGGKRSEGVVPAEAA